MEIDDQKSTICMDQSFIDTFGLIASDDTRTMPTEERRIGKTTF